MPRMIPNVIALFAVVGFGSMLTADDWVQLFNGKDLSGWIPKFRGCEPGVNFSDTFQVEDGLLRVSYENYDQFDRRFGHLFYQDEFSHYRLRIEYRFVGDQCPGGASWAFRNSGVMLHGQSLASMTKEQDFPDSIEVQFLGGDGTNQRRTANLCTPGTHVVLDGALFEQHCTDSTSKTYHGDQWVTVEIEVRGNDRIRHQIDGVTVLEYSKPQLDDGTLLRSGSISLQAESHPVEFRKIEIQRLEEDAD